MRAHEIEPCLCSSVQAFFEHVSKSYSKFLDDDAEYEQVEHDLEAEFRARSSLVECSVLSCLHANV